MSRLVPINPFHGVDRFNQAMQQRDARAQSQRSQELQERLTLAKLAELDQANKLQQRRAGVLADLAAPQQVAGTGPLRGAQDYQPVQFHQQPLTRERVSQGLAAIGDVEGALKYMPEQVTPDYHIVQDATGQFVRIPKQPGLPAVPTGVSGETGRGKSVINIDTKGKFGTIPPGYTLKETPDGYMMEPIPGSPAEREVKQKESTAEKAAREADAKWEVVSNNVDKALDQVGFFTTGFVGNMLSSVPGSSAYDLGQTIDTVKANIGFDTLQKMREASPTGGALGSVSERELALLERAISSLDQAQSRNQLVGNLVAVRNHYNNWKDVMRQSGKKDRPGSSGGTSTGSSSGIKFLGFE